MSYIDYSELNSLEKTFFIAGSTQKLIFNACQQDGTPIDLGGATIKWGLCPYGNSDFTSLDKSGTITDTSTFEIDLSDSDTENLEGTFIQQPIITAFTGEVYRPAQGVVVILPKISVS